MSPEFRLIARYFTHRAPGAVLGVGDDAALVRARAESQLAISTDMLVAGTHFFAGADPVGLGHKALAVNLSDMAAMGATPRWCTLAIALPKLDEPWVAGLARGFMALARRHRVDLIGGDTTRGALSLCVTIIGEVPRGRALRRDGARAGDDVWVSGVLGDAALAVAHRQGRVRLTPGELRHCTRSLDYPTPRLSLGIELRGLANSAIDVSDGLVADLGHIGERSHLGAEILWRAVPCSPRIRSRLETEVGRGALLGGGDDYELCFTAPAAARRRIEDIAARLRVPLARVGAMRRGRGVRVVDERGRRLSITRGGYDHFR